MLDEFFPNFEAITTIGPIKFYEWLGNSWCLLISYITDFNSVCTTELARVIELYDEFKRRNVKVIGLSCDSLESHNQWMVDIEAYAKHKLTNQIPFPIIADVKCDLAITLNLISSDPQYLTNTFKTFRGTFLIDPEKKTRFENFSPLEIGRNFEEIIRTIDALQLVDKHMIVTPADWQPGQDVLIPLNIPEDKLFLKFPNSTTKVLPSGKTFIRQTRLH